MKNTYQEKYSTSTQALQTLLSTISQIISDGKLSDSDILDLRYWMDANKHLSGNYPFDKIYSIIDDILSDGVIEDQEKDQLLSFLSNEKICDHPLQSIETLANCHVVLTGNFYFMNRMEIEKLIASYGGICDKGVNHSTDYLFVGGLGSRDYAYGKYGAKVKKAKEMQEHGHHIQILSEDVLDAFFRNNPLVSPEDLS